MIRSRKHTSSHSRSTKSFFERLESRVLMAVQVSGFTDELVTSGLTNPTAMEFAPDGRLFVCQQGGALRVIDQNGTLLAANFATLTVDSVGERGLLGIAFDPNYATNRFVYVYHTVGGTPAHNRISRFTADANNPNVAAGSATTILDLDDLSSATNHNGGAIHFGADGKLYVAVGENANGNNAQSLNNRLGKMLRLNSDGTAPSDNPFYTNNATVDPRDYIWSRGLRNPFTFAVDPADGTMHINDVGEVTWEEINVGQRGVNYGWPNEEGPESPQDPAYADPLFYYNHNGANDDTGNVIAGGTFYRRPAGAANPLPDGFDGDYFYADAGHGWIRWLDDNTTNTNLMLNNSYGIVDLKIGPDGSLYYVSRNGSSSTVRRIRYTVQPPSAPDLISDTGANTSDNLSNDNTPTFFGSAPTGATVRLYEGNTEIGSGVAVSGAYSITTSVLSEGVHVITARSTVSGNTSATSASLSITLDLTRPQAISPTFQFAVLPQTLTIGFTENVGASLELDDVSVINQTNGNSPANPTGFSPLSQSVTYQFSGVLGDGNYLATIPQNEITDSAGNALLGDVNFNFSFLAGDANGDRKVDIQDLVIFMASFMQPGKNFTQGNFDYIGLVDRADLAFLARNWQKTLPNFAPPAQVSAFPKRPPFRSINAIM